MENFQCESGISGRGIEILSTGGGLGAEVRGVDLRQIGDAEFIRIHRALLDNLVLLFRGQRLSDAELVAFSRRFGDLDFAPVQETGRRFVEGMPEVYVVSNVVKGGEPIGSLGAGEASWHTDMSYLDDPPMASLLYAIEVPSSGGNTEFINMYSVYEALPAGFKHRIAGLRLKHDGTYNSGGYVRRASHLLMTHALHLALIIPWFAHIRKRSGACFILAAVETPMSKTVTWQLHNSCLMNFGPTPSARNSPGTMCGGLVIWSCGTIAAQCTGAMRLTRP